MIRRLPPRARLNHRLLESLEPRLLLSVTIAPNAHSATYSDVDGDHVTLTLSKGALLPANFTTAPSGAGELLQLLDLSAGGFDNANLTVSVHRVPGGDGLVNIGFIDSSGHDLANVSVPGDLGRINAGDANTATPGLQSLSVRSLGRLDIATQAPGGSLDSTIVGSLGSLTVKSDILTANLLVTGGASLSDGTIGSVTLGGSLIAGAVAATGDIGPVKIAGDILGGSSLGAGLLTTLGSLKSVTLGGSLVGGSGQDSGEIVATTSLGPVSIAHDLRGGSGPVTSGVITSRGTLASVKIAGSLVGGAGPASGQIHSTADMGPVSIAHDLRGNLGDNSAQIISGANLASLTVGGSLLGSLGESSANVSVTGNIASLSIAHDVLGSGTNSASINANGNVVSLKIGGSFIGGFSENAAKITTRGNLNSLSVAHDILGGGGRDSAGVFIGANLGNLTIGGSIVGGNGDTSASISAQFSIGKTKIGNSLIGGNNISSGNLTAGSSIASVSIAGSLLGGSANNTGEILAASLGPISIGHDIRGGSVSGVTSLDSSALIEASNGSIASLTVGGSIVTGANTSTGSLTNNASIRAADDIGKITVKGSLIGNRTPSTFTPVIISARGQASPSATSDIALASLTVKGRVELTHILAGYDTGLNPVNGNAQITSLTVSGDWIASSAVAGAQNPFTLNTNFGLNDSLIPPVIPNALSRIASISIAGQLLGTPDILFISDHFGFVARQILSLKIAGNHIPLNPLPDTDNFNLSLTNDFTIHEV
jgi:hypothetical protein